MSTSSPVLVVTGGSRGIGAAIVRMAAARGWRVAFDYAADDAAAARLAVPGQVVALKGDAADEAHVAALFDAAARLGPVRGAVANAGITGGKGRVAEFDRATLDRVLAINVTGAFLLAKHAIGQMTGGGSIVMISSMAARLGGGGEWVHYALSKGAVDTMTIGLSREVARQGIRVNAVAPGMIETEIHAAAGDPDRAQRMGAETPMGRAGSADEVAEAVLWLLSDAASYVTGAIMPIAGGR